MSWAESCDGHEIEILQECGRLTRASWPPGEMVSWTPATVPSLWNYPSPSALAVIFYSSQPTSRSILFFLHEFCYATSWFSLFMVFLKFVTVLVARLLVRRSWSGLQVLPGTSVFVLVPAAVHYLVVTFLYPHWQRVPMMEHGNVAVPWSFDTR